MTVKQGLAGLTIAGLLAAGLTWHLWPTASEAEPPGGRGDARAIPVETAAVRRTTVRDTARFSGALEARSGFTVAPRITGRLHRLMVDIGDTVTNGQLIAVIDDAEYAQQLTQARAEFNVAAANLAESVSALVIAERDLERTLSLHTRGVVSESERDAAQARYDAAAARRQVADAQRDQRDAVLAAAQIRLAYTRLHAHWADQTPTRVVGERHIHEGSLLSAGQPIVSVLDIDRLVAGVTVTERDYPNLVTGQAARIVADALPDLEFNGTVARIAPMISDTSRQARMEIDLDNTDRLLRPGMFVRADIELSATDNACVIPLNALVRRDGETGVFLVDGPTSTVRFTPITAGVSDRVVLQVLEPELSGDVVTLGRHLLSDGSPIRIIE